MFLDPTTPETLLDQTQESYDARLAGSAHKEDGSEFDLEEVIATESAVGGALNPYPANGRLRRRTVFATDYSWAFSRLDDLTELIRREVENKGAQDDRWVRINALINGAGDVTKGEAVFRAASDSETCTDCHGEGGLGDIGPNLTQVFTRKTEWQLIHTILNGRGDMPAWGEILTDGKLTDLFAYLRTTLADEPAIDAD